MKTQWNAVVLAGDRGPTDAVAQAAGVSGKALATLQGVTLIERVVTALRASNAIDNIYTLGPSHASIEQHPDVAQCLRQQQVHILEAASGPSASALRGVQHCGHYPVLIVTCDLPLLNARMIDEYCRKMQTVNADFVACAIDYSHIQAKIPELKKTQYQFAGQSVCFANLFAVLKPPGLNVIEYWQDVEKSRKKPIQLIRKIDWLSLLKYKAGRLSMDQLVQKLSEQVEAKLAIESMAYPELAIDVDSAQDYQIMQRFLST